MRKLLLSACMLISIGVGAAEYVPVITHDNNRVDPVSTATKCKNLNGTIVSKAYYKEAIGAVCMIGDKEESQDFTVVAVANQNVNNVYQDRSNMRLSTICEQLGGELTASVSGKDKTSAGVCALKH